MSEGTANSLTVRIAIGLYCLVGAGFLGQGLRYLVSDALMDYHMAVIGIPWDAIGHSYQALLLGLLRGFGAGAFCVGFTVIVLALGPLRSGMAWARWVTPVLAGTYADLLLAITRSALLPGATPIAVTAALFCLVCVAALFFYAGAFSKTL